MRMILGLISLSVTVLIVGCQANSVNPEVSLEATAVPAPPSTLQPVPPVQGDTTDMSPPIPTPAASGTERLFQLAKEDLSRRLSVPSTQISLTEITEVEWSDSSLDCPQPGMDYLQVITPGYRILLEAGGSMYEYHSNRDTYVIYCENSIPLVPPPKP